MCVYLFAELAGNLSGVDFKSHLILSRLIRAICLVCDLQPLFIVLDDLVFAITNLNCFFIYRLIQCLV